eukprot:3941485-Rhodomonas_salina.1
MDLLLEQSGWLGTAGKARAPSRRYPALIWSVDRRTARQSHLSGTDLEHWQAYCTAIAPTCFRMMTGSPLRPLRSSSLFYSPFSLSLALSPSRTADTNTVDTVRIAGSNVRRGPQITETHSISAGLDYPGVGPEHAWLKDSGRAEYSCVTDSQVSTAPRAVLAARSTSIKGHVGLTESGHVRVQALEAMQTLSKTEGIIPALVRTPLPHAPLRYLPMHMLHNLPTHTLHNLPTHTLRPPLKLSLYVPLCARPVGVRDY